MDALCPPPASLPGSNPPACLQGSYAITGATLTNATAEAEFMARFSSQQYVAGAVFSALGLVSGRGGAEWPSPDMQHTSDGLYSQPS